MIGRFAVAALALLLPSAAEACSLATDDDPVEVVPSSGSALPSNFHIFFMLDPRGQCEISPACEILGFQDRLSFELRPLPKVEGRHPAPLHARITHEPGRTVVDLQPKGPVPPGPYDLAVRIDKPTCPKDVQGCDREPPRMPERIVASYLVEATPDREPPTWSGFAGGGVLHHCPEDSDGCGSAPAVLVLPVAAMPDGAVTTTDGRPLIALWLGREESPDPRRTPDVFDFIGGRYRDRRLVSVPDATLHAFVAGHPGVPKLRVTARAVDAAGQMSAPSTVEVDLKPVCRDLRGGGGF